MLRKYDPVSDLLEYEEVGRWTRIPLRFLAGNILEDIGCTDEAELEDVLGRAFGVCCMAGIPIRQHFRRVYVSRDGETQADWLCSDLGVYLLLVNSNARHPNVARAQVFFLQRLLQRS